MKKFCILFLLPIIAGFSNGPVNSHQPRPQKTTNITPNKGPMGNSNVDVVIDAEFLWWRATVENLSYATRYIVSPVGDTTAPTNNQALPKRHHEFDWDWDPGVRVGLGVVTNHDGWDVYADWTYTYNSTSRRHSVPAPLDSFTSSTNPAGTEFLATPWNVTNGTGLMLTEVSARWSVLFNQIDLELGRKFWISDNLTLRPYAGIRGHWSRMYFRVKGFVDTNDAGLTTDVTERDTYKQKFWGVGLLSGLDTAWHITKNWAIFGEAALALVYGPYDIRTRTTQLATNSTPEVVANFTGTVRHDNIYTLQPILDLALGLRWESTLYNESYRLSFDAGWEHHVVTDFNHLDVNTSTSQIQNTYRPADGDLSLMGLVLRGRFEF